jgi:hypothetical protein
MVWMPRSWRRALDEFELMEEPSREATADAFLALPYPVRLFMVLSLGEPRQEAGIPTFWMPPSWQRGYLAYERHVDYGDEGGQAFWDAMPRLLRTLLCAQCGFQDALSELCPPLGDAWQRFKDRVVPRRIRFCVRYEITRELHWLLDEYPEGIPAEELLALTAHFDPTYQEDV